MIIHSVAFKLKEPKEASRFLKKSYDQLADIPGVNNFQIYQILGDKNPYDYEFVMAFEDQADYDAYNIHPKHYNHKDETGYVPEIWLKEVASFLEKDTVLLDL